MYRGEGGGGGGSKGLGNIPKKYSSFFDAFPYEISFNFDHQIKTDGTPVRQCSVVLIHDEIGL